MAGMQIKKLKIEISTLEKRLEKLQRVDPEKQLEKQIDSRVRSSVGSILPPDKVDLYESSADCSDYTMVRCR